jgi:hypothetical protein
LISSVSSVKYALFLSYFNETNSLGGFSKKNPQIRSQKHLSSGSRVVPCGQTDRYEASSRFSELCEVAKQESRGHLTLTPLFLACNGAVATDTSVRVAAANLVYGIPVVVCAWADTVYKLTRYVLQRPDAETLDNKEWVCMIQTRV